MKKADHFTFFLDFMKALLESLEQQATVTSFSSERLGIEIEFEVHVKSINGKRLGRVTQAQADRINAVNRSAKL